MHSSRMRTVRSSNYVYPSMHRAGGVSQHALGRGVDPSMHWAGVCPKGCLPRGLSTQGAGGGVYPSMH